MTYKPDQLQPVSNMIRTPNIVSAHPSVRIKSIAELIAYIKANPEKLSYASSGVGQSPHLTVAWFLQLTGLKMLHVPFRGAGRAQAALGGDIQILFDNLYPSLPQVADGKLNALCGHHAAAQRPGAEYSHHAREPRRNWQNSTSRPGSACSCRRPRPRPIVDALNKEIKVFLEREDIRKNSPRWARAPTTAHRSNIPISCRGDREIRRHHQARRPADGTPIERMSPGVAQRTTPQGRRHHREGRVADGDEGIWRACGAGDLIQWKTRNTAAASPIANIVRG